MSLAEASAAPLPFEPDRGDEALARLPPLPAGTAALIRGVAGCSPFLRGLIAAEADWLAERIDADPAAILPALTAEVAAAPPEAAARALRQARRRLALYVALADCGGLWPLEQVTGTLTAFADFAVGHALDVLLRAELERGRVPGCGPDLPDDRCGLVVLAMGKMGAGELNYSSDIDLIVLFDEQRHAPADFEGVRQAFIRITRRLMRMLSEVTPEGFVFRTDLRLRPDPSVTPVCLSFAAAERYYEAFGRTWERAAFIKARPAAGDIAAGARFLEALRPFVWRKYLDFAAIEDAHDMRQRIRAHKGLSERAGLAGLDLKLGPGGIREIEFFTQTRQLIAGGRDPALRARATVPALAALAERGWIPQEAADALTDAYRAHRQVEHRLQMLNDAQTHALPKTDQGFARLAAFLGHADPAPLKAALRARLARVRALTEPFFGADAGPAVALSDAPLPAFAETPEAQETIDAWHRYPALRSARAQAIFRRIRPLFLGRIAETPDPLVTLRNFDAFLKGLPAGVQLFSLFQANPQLIELLVDICGTAPGLARNLSRHAGLLDAVIGGGFFAPLPAASAMADELARALAAAPDYEEQLATARRFMRERHFRIGVQQLKGMIGGEEAATHYAALAEAVLRALLPVVIEAFAARHGPLPGRGVAVLGMGSLGARTMTAGSDLDLIVIYDAAGQTQSSGPRPLPVSTWFARLTQALVTALGARMAEGRLYDVDMRLRPSGRKGPVATALAGFRDYQLHKAWTWEHLALTRARIVAGAPDVGAAVEEVRREVLAAPHDPARVLADGADMLRRIREAAGAEPDADPWEAKAGPGRLQEIELLAQAAALVAGSPRRAPLDQLALAVDAGWLDGDEVARLQAAWRRLFRLRQVTRLVAETRFDPARLGPGACRLLLAETGAESLAALERQLADDRAGARAVIDRLFDPSRGGPGDEPGDGPGDGPAKRAGAGG